MRVIQVADDVWLVCDVVLKPRLLIVRGPAVHRGTGETHIMYRIDRHHMTRAVRKPVAWRETFTDAVAYCREVLETPDMTAPIRASYSSVITSEMQQERWRNGLDPRTGEPRT